MFDRWGGGRAVLKCGLEQPLPSAYIYVCVPKRAPHNERRMDYAKRYDPMMNPAIVGRCSHPQNIYFLIKTFDIFLAPYSDSNI